MSRGVTRPCTRKQRITFGPFSCCCRGLKRNCASQVYTAESCVEPRSKNDAIEKILNTDPGSYIKYAGRSNRSASVLAEKCAKSAEGSLTYARISPVLASAAKKITASACEFFIVCSAIFCSMYWMEASIVKKTVKPLSSAPAVPSGGDRTFCIEYSIPAKPLPSSPR